MVKFIPYDEDVHRTQLFELNVEYVSWVTDETQARHDIDVMAEVKHMLREYVEAFLDDLLVTRPPEGMVYVLEDDGDVVGMGALKKLEEGIAEIKRMYIRPQYRGKGLGKKLLKKLMAKGKEFGYPTIRLQTADWMTIAHRIYRSAGFKEIDEYPGGEVPPGKLRSYTRFMEKRF